MLAHLRQLGHGRDDLGREAERVGRDEADALDTVDGRHLAQQIGEADLAPALGETI